MATTSSLEDLRLFYIVDEEKGTQLNTVLFEKLSFPPIIRYRAQALKAR